MRFALMIEPQQGLSYGDQVAIAKRAEANGFETLFRSDHYQSFPGVRRTSDDRRLGGPRRPRSRYPADRTRRARLADDVPTPGELREGRDDRRRDERRPDRGRRRRGLERGRAPPARPAVPADRRTGGPARGHAGDPARAVGRAGRLVVHAATRSRSTARNFHPKPVDVPGRPRTAIGGARPRILIGGRARHARSGWRRATPTSSTSTPGAPTTRARPTPSSTPPAGRSGATRARWRDRRWSASSSVGTTPRCRPGSRRPPRRSVRTPTTWPGWRSGRPAGSPARPGQARAALGALRSGGRRADRAPGFPALGPGHDRRHGRDRSFRRCDAGRGRLGRRAPDARRPTRPLAQPPAASEARR